MPQKNSVTLLAELLSAMQHQGPSGNNRADIATQLLRDYRVTPPKSPETSSSAGPSVLERIFDVLSRPNYAIAETVDRITDDLADVPGKEGLGYIAEGFWKGLAGQEKTTFTKLWTDAQKKAEGEATLTGSVIPGLFLDIFTDPTTYLGAGLIGKAGRSPKIAEEVGEAMTVGDKVLDVAQKTPDLPPSIAPTPKLPETAGTAIPGAKITSAPFSYSDEALAGLRTADEMGAPPKAKKPTMPPELAMVQVMNQMPPNILDEVLQSGGLSRANFDDELRMFQSRMDEMAEFDARAKSAKQGIKSQRDFAKRQEAEQAPFKRAEEIVQGIARGDRDATIKALPKPHRYEAPTEFEISAGTHIGRTAQRRMKIKDRFLNPVQQLELFKNALKSSPAEGAAKLSQATKILRETEEFLLSQGVGMKSWDGQSVRLSDLISELGGTPQVEILKGFTSKKPPLAVAQALENLRARSAVNDSPLSELAIETITKKVSESEVKLTPAQSFQASKNVLKEAEAALKAGGVAPANVKGTVGIINNILKSRSTGAQQALDRSARQIDVLMAGGPEAGKIAAKINTLVTNEIEKVIGQTAEAAGKEIGKGARTFDWLGQRFATQWGMKDLRPHELDMLLSAESNAARRLSLWETIVKNTTEAERVGAWRAVRGELPPANVQEEKLSDYFRNVMSRLFDTTGINSVATRSGFAMKELNKELKRVGSQHYFVNEGWDNWLDSWKGWNLTDDPIKHISRLELATERLAAKYALFDDIAARWGSRMPKGEFKYKVNDPRFAGYYFDAGMRDQVNKMLSNMDNIYEPNSKAAKMFDAIQRIWKTHVTIYSPSHHINNLIGDAWLSWMAGVNNPLVYKKAADVLKGQSRRYASLDEMEDLITRSRPAKAGGKEILKKYGKPVTADEIYVAAHRRGLLLSAKQLEDIFGDELFRGVKPFGGKVHGVASAITQRRDHWMRLAHFIDAVGKSRAKSLDEAFDEAAHTVRKYHPDGMDLTNFERKVMRRIIPFYSWQRKSIPLILKFLVQKPGKIAMIPKFLEAAQAAAGIEAPSRSQSFPVDQLFPDWMRESGIGPIARTGMEGLPGLIASLSRQGVNPLTGEDIGGYTIVSPANPFVDSFAEFAGHGKPSDFLRGVAGQVTPFAKVPLELYFDENVRTGAPVSSDLNRYVTEQIPLVGIGSRITGLGVAGPTERGAAEGFNLEALVNWLFGAGIIGTGPYQKQAQVEEGIRRSNQ